MQSPQFVPQEVQQKNGKACLCLRHHTYTAPTIATVAAATATAAAAATALLVSVHYPAKM